MADTPENYAGKPMWVQNQRNSWHGVDFPYHSDLDIAEYYRRYAETLLAVDESVGRIVRLLRERGLLDSTLVMFMGDNGFAFGEHGLIDKRTAYEESMRVPLLMAGGGLSGRHDGRAGGRQHRHRADGARGGRAARPPAMDGRSFLPLARGERMPWRDALLYEYYWERNFPQTPTMHALRGDRYKYIRYYGIWDTDELYDLQADPLEMRNLIRDPAHRRNRVPPERASCSRRSAPPAACTSRCRRTAATPNNLRRRAGSPAAAFLLTSSRDDFRSLHINCSVTLLASPLTVALPSIGAASLTRIPASFVL